ncbi:MAG: hypothetical protein A3C43_01830 [Candidatus Schekmanbacteria bacterium RIFCSPHIGHO2_02_FULL_38_11]|uniref:Radical SAM core domain-containing protein n=1 Tax=Candidatus Schekmanbacteria bacterium RIFCSPLOWO2_12_FULL_38_15 TaxID=1817883 RepID=A0A1F7SHP6_9BACT|nr:MAG: hypothetical protein A3H37_03705 [Candidatus Schekmanbacteria bacterium RIFCSPLOWO2_02_FULL_38_14]OGL53320.1 MAG: hypothetical protein A3G31_07360 [Candidatus Schekmanbacteria bacterium RIFCSPLOWO2_12_FULL_38_15]OGL54795.1 MAG: hypothetical protein A3C43_01830 [Candidatus Schekmanbacteria bacterium RIFCSPHIGHO2_02_FULL_38_11]
MEISNTYPRFKNALCMYPYKKELASMGFMPPLGLEYIATVLSKSCERVSIVDLRYEKNGLNYFFKNKPDLACVSVNWDQEKNNVRRRILEIPPDIFTIVGGRAATDDVDNLFSECPNIDIIVKGDGENTIREIIENKPLSEIQGISYRNKGEIIHNPYRKLEKLDPYFIIDRSLRKYEYKLISNGFDFGYTVDGIFSSRGCPYNCSFCSFNNSAGGGRRKWEGRSPETVVKEIKSIKSDVIIFLDENFTFNTEGVNEICDILIREKVNKMFTANARVDVAKSPETIRKMQKAGFKVLLFGIESAQNRILKQFNKGFTIEEARECFSVLRQHDMYYHGYFIIGSPEETRDEMFGIAGFAKQIGLHSIGVSNLRCSQYAPLYNVIKKLNGYQLDKRGRVYSDTYSVADLKKIRKAIYRKFYNLSSFWKIFSFAIFHRVLKPKVFFSLIKSSCNIMVGHMADRN